jgi:16S rRNA (cytosine967-C5)-methyltransferase
LRARLVAWQLLRDTKRLTRRTLVRAARDAELDPRDRIVLARTLGAEVRRRGALRAIAERFAERRLRPDVALFAHVGLAQLLFADHIPDHAAIAETTEAARTALGERPARAVHALLRTVQRETRRGASDDPRRDVPLAGIHFDERIFADPHAHWLLWAEQALSLPVPIGRRWRKRLGDEVSVELARASLLLPDISLFVRGDVDAVREELASLEPRTTTHPRILLVRASRLGELRGCAPLQRGDAVRMGEMAARSIDLLERIPYERVLELRACATHGARPRSILATGVERRALADAPQQRPVEFDAVFVAAPSSSTGNLAARPAERWRFDAPRLARLALVQRSLLEQAASNTHPGGRLVYATHSLEPDENQRRVRAFLAEHPEWSLEHEIEARPAAHPRIEAENSTFRDGGYAARLRRA